MEGISKRSIRVLENDIRYRRSVYKNKTNNLEVSNIEIGSEYIEIRNVNIYNVQGEVRNKKTNKVELAKVSFIDIDGIHSTDCTCMMSNSYYELCPHVTALIKKFITEPDKIIKKFEEVRVNRIIENLKFGIVKNNIKKEQLIVKPKLIYENNMYGRKYYLELKVGINKLYVVKNMKNFLSIVNKKSDSLEFGKTFIYNPLLQKFKDEDSDLIKMLLSIYDSQVVLDKEYNKMYTFLKGKRVLLTENQLKNFLEIYNERSFDFEIGELKLENIEIKNEKVPLEFDILQNKRNNDIYVKHISEIPNPLTSDGEYFYYYRNIYKTNKEFRSIYNNLYNLFIKSKNNLISFKKEYVDKIGLYIIPSLKKISNEVNIDEDINDKFFQEKLIVKTYLDEKKEKVLARLKFLYGEECIDLNEKNNKDSEKILIRDVEGEYKAKCCLGNYGFEEEKGTYVLTGDEKIVKFLEEGVLKLQEIGEVYYSEAFKNIKIHTASSIYSSIRLNDEDLLEFSFGAGEIDRKELKNILNAVREKKKYYRLKKGGFVSIKDKKWKDINDLVDYLDIKDSDIVNDKIVLSKYQAMYLEQSTREKDMEYIEKNKKFIDLVNNMKDIKTKKFILPKSLNNIMRNYQKLGFKWFKTLDFCGFGGILADEMGLGKTIQSIAFILSEVEKNNKKPNIVISPTSLVYNWKNEIEKFAPNLSVLVICGNKDERVEQIKQIDKYDVVLTTYPLIRRDIDMYKMIAFNYCFLDEAQQIKNPNSLNAKSVKEIKAKNRFVLTGTPIENSLTELWSIFDFIMPGYLLSHGKFMSKYESPIIKDKNEKALQELNRHIKPFIMRRLKKDVMKELPPKIEHNILVEMTEEQKKIYMAYLQSAKEEMQNEINDKGLNSSKIKILSLLTRLRQICCDPSVFIDNYHGESGKIEVLENLLKEIIEGGHKILIFSQFTTVLKQLVKMLNKNKFEYLYLDGSTNVKERGHMVQEFNEGDKPIFLISLKAGGTGLNLTGADTVIHFDPWWNPAVEEQASDRAHRIGQKKTVEVIRLITRGTIEEKIQKLQENKKNMIKDVMEFEGKDINVLSHMNKEEIEELFKVEN